MVSYLSTAHRKSYNFLFAGILLVLYEGILFLTPHPVAVNLVGSWFERMLAFVPYGTWLVSGALILLTIFYVERDRRAGEPVQAGYLAYMWAESLVWALVLYFNLSILVYYLPFSALVPAQASVGGNEIGFIYALGLSFGAGFYEELFFRLLLVNLFIFLFKTFDIGLDRFSKHLIIIVATALLFALAHHIPPYGEPLEFNVLLYRTVFGMAMSVLMLFRGFGITAWTHALYDVLIDIKNFL